MTKENGGTFTRREFLKGIGVGGGAVVLFGQFGIHSAAWALSGEPTLKMVVVDYNKCTGCRTCETACSSRNRPASVSGKELPGLGNPYFANIMVHNFNPDVDVPNVCAMCADTPCARACPVEPDPKTGRRALYRDQGSHTMRNDAARCIGCGSCAKACASQRTGVISPNPETGKPERMCTLCGGDPQCVKRCPFGALSYVEVRRDRKFYGLGPKKIAAELARNWYGTAGFGGVK
ncbi:4Fe-4S dicluster domain-containing protein [Geomonas sp. Red69]|uniref:4Fe-4S dicluster domain-containing protein n=1 Tax=Geomonas diazotrophica TaxID=2843197 RepID=A0ABX8JKL9_9BACT|nr:MULTISPECIES: 4Fe-4S dicluster domain-containing protein [Geomonas]MBU5637482.1 4Fe-4S dicluster domain-containing protein [Geomonas diazotrophica]QWV97852.1 4Fe-4S dicluster domain-containing protein [Geomonas nitrogeniifigens]QXE86992.1 4Fe-4S dicluster domain-containing protein [Geomonas nitrogeniifigens]